MRLLLVGAGRMGSAMLRGWLASSAHEIHVLRPRPKAWLSDFERDGLVLGYDEAAALSGLSFDAVILAVKPQLMPEVLDELVPHLASVNMLLSVAAGLERPFYRKYFPHAGHVIRAMPNTPSAVGDGTIICVGSDDLSVRGQVHELLQAMGHVAWINDEAQMHGIIALSGSGPAYLFLLAQIMAEEAQRLGVPAEMTRDLAARTIRGAGNLLLQGLPDPEELKRNVASPGGTTQAALDVLEANPGLRETIASAMEACAKRSAELAKN